MNGFCFGSVYVPFRIEIFSLTFVSRKKIKAWPRSVIVFAHVPLANVGCFVSLLTKAHGPMRELGGQLGKIIANAMVVGIKSRKN